MNLNILFCVAQQEILQSEHLHLFMIHVSDNNWQSLTKLMNTACVRADESQQMFEVSCDSDVSDDVHVNTVQELDFLSIRKLNFKRVSIQLQHNLKQKRCL